ncbi:MAG: hypothetical protein ABII13_03005 [Patescibacteria group bacterium]|nr:hypothetical protein [Patescibacteria group bacterium]MBU2509658.1 hypothetical protein [Patescibacteria group bacterium]
MARLATIEKGQWDQFDRKVSSTLTAEELQELNRYPKIWDSMLVHMRTLMGYERIRGCFHSLDEKIEIVKGWPMISDRFTEVDFQQALKEAEGRLKRFEQESPKNHLLNVVVSVYWGSVVETFLYGRDRLKSAFGSRFQQLDVDYEVDDLGERLQLIDGVQDHKNCIRVEVVDLGANWNQKDGMVPKDVRNAQSAHATVLFAGAQDPDWVRLMDRDKGVPCALMGGYNFTVIGSKAWEHLPNLWFYYGDREARLGASLDCGPFHDYSLPVLWE